MVVGRPCGSLPREVVGGMRWAIGGFLVLHGLGHSMGVLGAWTKVEVGFTDRPWILPGEISVRGPVGRAWALLWLVAIVAWVAAGLGVISDQDWWQPLAAVGAVASLLAIVPWWNTVPAGARLGGAIVDLVAIGVLAGPWRETLIERFLAGG